MLEAITQIVLRPRVVIRASDDCAAARLHHGAHAKCCIASLVNLPIVCEPVIELAAD